MNKIIYFLFFTQISLSFSQEIITDIQGKKLSYFETIEKNQNGILVKTYGTHILPDNLAQPITYKRKENIIPDLLVQYTVDKKDSIVNNVFYEWNVYNFDQSLNNTKSDEFNKALIKKYYSLLKTLTDKYGQSKSEGGLENLNEINSKEGLKRHDEWKPNDNMEIEMYIVISNYYEKRGFVTFNPTHKIRLYIRSR